MAAPTQEGPGTVPATLFVLHDSNDLYFGIQIMHAEIGRVAIRFDNDNDGGRREPGDDYLWIQSSTGAYDGVVLGET